MARTVFSLIGSKMKVSFTSLSPTLVVAMRIGANSKAWLSVAAVLALVAGNLAPCHCPATPAELTVAADDACCASPARPLLRDSCCCADGPIRGEPRSYVPPLTTSLHDHAAVVAVTPSVPLVVGEGARLAPEDAESGAPSDLRDPHSPRAPPARV